MSTALTGLFVRPAAPTTPAAIPGQTQSARLHRPASVLRTSLLHSRKTWIARMPTTVPDPKDGGEVVKRALALAHDCQGAFTEASKKASDPKLKEALSGFASAAGKHVEQWRNSMDTPPEKESGFTTALNEGKVKFASLVGDKPIVLAIQNNTQDQTQAYEGITKRNDLPKETISLAQSMLQDTRKQVDFVKSWLAEH